MKTLINNQKINQINKDIEISKTIFLPEILKDENVVGVLFTGSRVIGDVNVNSDYDFRVLLKDGADRYRKGFYINNLFAETYCNCYVQEISYLANEITQGNFKCLDLFMYKTGVIIFDPTFKMSEIKSKAIELYDLGPKPISEKEIDWIRYDLAINKLKLEGLDSSKDCLFYILDLQYKLFDYFFKLYNVWTVRSRQMDEKVVSIDPLFYNQLKQISDSNLTHQKIELLIKTIQHLQNKFKLEDSIEFSL